MKIKQFEYKPLAHYSYAIISNGEMAIIDPERDPLQYYRYAQENNALITMVIETHPHADFVSSHLQIFKETGATIYNSEKLGANYPHEKFDEGDSITIGKIALSALNTPGHSPDSITIVAKEGTKTVLFTGDTLFIGDVGRPDLREKVGNMKAKRQELAEAMYQTIQTKFKNLPDDAVVYPAHGAGSLCGKSMSKANSSTLGNERMANWAFKKQTQEDFVRKLLDSQPFIPSYFGFNVDTNKNGATNVEQGIANVPFLFRVSSLEQETIVIDTRDEGDFKKGHLSNSINIMARGEDDKFETWLGATLQPKEPYYLVVDGVNNIHEVLSRVTKIGYEKQLKAVVTLSGDNLEQSENLDFLSFNNNPKAYTLVDIRNRSEVDQGGKVFENAINIPLNELRESLKEIPTQKPIIVYCAGGYRSTIGSSIIAKEITNTKVFDLGEKINEFK